MIPTSIHLTTEQLYDLLDRPTHATGTHLHVCATCQQEFATLRASLDNLRVAATNLAAAEMPPLAARRPSPTTRFAFHPQAFAASLATAAALLTLSVTLLRSHHGAPVAPADPVVVSSPEADAALLDSIQQDLSASVPPSLAPLEVPSLDPHN